MTGKLTFDLGANIEAVREATLEAASDDDVLDFTVKAIEMGATQAQAETIDEMLTLRMMRAKGAI